MFADFEYLANDDAVEPCSSRLDAVDLVADHGQAMGELRCIQRRADPFT